MSGILSYCQLKFKVALMKFVLVPFFGWLNRYEAETIAVFTALLIIALVIISFHFKNN